ncbi:MAG TPA: hypothetical protein ENF52_05590, partial [Chloroflexi bacterium]|nr:hypothetical protein [Chloroflexota bacterium]
MKMPGEVNSSTDGQAPSADVNLNAGLTAEEYDRLHPYLPADYQERDTLSVDAASVLRHLTDLLDMVITYLPRYLVQLLWPLPLTDVPRVGGEFLNGALLFADISGFTAMSERMSTLGKEGDEQVTELINRYFSTMLEVIFAHGGDLFKFGGDALLAFFPDANDANADGVGGPLSAVMAAWEMQAAMTAFHQVKTGLGTFPLRMKIGMHSGAVFAARVGDADGQEFIVTGPTVNATARAESLASAGQILISEEMYAQVEAMRPGFLTVAPGPEGHQVVMALGANSASRFVSPPGKSFPLPAGADLVLPDEPWPTSVRRILIALERLTPYLPTGLLPRLVPAPFRHETGGEHRLVVVLFANFVGASELIVKAGKARSGAIADALSAYFTTVQQIISRYGGVVNKVDLYDHGDKLMALFGAPIAYEDDVERAIRAALEMRTATQAPDFQERVGFLRSQRIGISSGVVFAGHVGSPHRREYTVMGDEVNLAARLMSAAQEGEILTSDYVHRKISTLFELVDRGAVQLKGKRLPVSTYAVVGERATSAAERGIHGLRSPLVSREKEMEALQKAVTRLWRRKEGRIISIISEAGLGKSRLAAELRTWSARFKDRIRWLEGRGLSYTQQVSYSVFIPIVQDALGITETDSVTDIWYKLRHRTAELLPKEVEEDILPYLAQFLSLPLSAQDAERVAYLEGEALQRQISRAITVFLEHLAYERPLVLVIDDLHWADSASLTLLERCLALAERAPLLLMLLYRPEKEHGCWSLGETAPREHPHHYTAITLQPLEREENQDVRLVCNLLNLEALPPTLEQLIGRAEGNPFYVE